MKNARLSAIALAVAAVGMASISIARADEAQAKGLLKAMSDYLGAQKTISFEYDTISNSSLNSSRRSGWQVPAPWLSSGPKSFTQRARADLRNSRWSLMGKP
jgi:hypothetical protein